MEKGIWIATIFMVFLISIGTLVLFEIIPVSGESISEIDQNQGVSEFRSDGVEIVHYQDGSKLYRASMNDGISTSDDLR